MLKSNLAIRLLTAAVAAPLILALLYLGPPWGFFVFLLVVVIIGAIEFFAMVRPGDKVSMAVGTLLTAAVMMIVWRWGTDPKVLLSLVFLLPFVSLLFVLLRLGDVSRAALRALAMTFAPLYLGGGLGALAMLRRDAGVDGPGFVVLALMLAWLSDAGAYFAGRFLGKHKLYEAVSPKKTVEGALGGLAGSVAGALLAHFFYLRSLPLADALILAIVAGGLGQAGDLGESMIKRSFGVKDSGGIVPGHGGIMDRVDALLVTGTISYLYVLWFRS